MGELAARTIFSNDTGPLAGTGLDTLAKNQGAILELEGAQAPQSKTITDGSISPTAAYVIVDTEGSAAADDLSVINPVLSASENLHDGMVIYLKAADSGRVVTVKNSSSANGINTYDGNDYVLSTTHWLKLQLRSGKWYEVEGRAMETALAAASAAAAASTPATTTSRGIGRVATSADLVDGATINNGPAFLAAGSEAERLLLRVTEKYDVGEFYYFRHPTLKTGFAAAQGGLISGAYQGKNITEYPIWDYLQTAEGQLLCKTEAEWQAMTTARWHTNADGTTVGWGGIGGAPYYVQDLGAGTLRMPDLRGMYAEAAGFDSLGVGGSRGDTGRDAVGTFSGGSNAGGSGVFRNTYNLLMNVGDGGVKPVNTLYTYDFALSRVMPTGPAFAPRRWGALACAYLGHPAS